MSGTLEQIGPYVLHDELGHGRFATVYRAWDTLRERELALKVLLPQYVVAPGALERARADVRGLSRLRHPHGVGIHEVGEVGSRLFVAMELVRGPSLAGELAERREGLPWGEMLALLRPVCAALDFGLRQGVVHQDVRPANILIDAERGPLLADFGFVRLLAACGVTVPGGVLGAASYLAPEVWRTGAGHGPADIYALACTAYEMLAGRPLFTGSTPTLVMWAHDAGARITAGWREKAPAGAETILRRALARDPQERYRSAVAFWRALRGLETGVPPEQEEAQQAARVEQRRAEAEAALARGDWDAARLAVRRWLTLAPEDAQARAAAARLQRQEVAAERERQADYWRAQTHATLALKDWPAARVALGRWLAVAPEDAEVALVQADLDAHEAAARAQQASAEAEDAAAHAREVTQARVWQEAAKRARRDM